MAVERRLQRQRCTAHGYCAAGVGMTPRVLGRQHDLIVRRTADDELLILDTARDQIHQLNQTAALIWTKLGEGLSDAEIARILCSAFDVEEQAANLDVSTTIDRFRALGLLA